VSYRSYAKLCYLPVIEDMEDFTRECRVQSAGAAVAWHVDARKVPLLTQLIVNWSFTTVSYPLLAILAMLVIKDDHKGEEPSINPASMDNNSKPV